MLREIKTNKQLNIDPSVKDRARNTFVIANEVPVKIFILKDGRRGGGKKRSVPCGL